ncbi:MAG: serine hydrolase [Alphaproteobacteria bacterium]|nr:serine hydrolase [Alphaproteobacteria bacterium]
MGWLRVALCVLLLTGSAAARTQLTAAQLAAGFQGPVVMDAFAAPADAMAPAARFEGRLRLDATVFRQVTVIKNAFNLPINDTTTGLPPFDFEFVQDGDALIPVQRGPVLGPHPYSEWVLEPGRVWNEPDDGGFTRAAVPFALREKNANCLHNGVLGFLFKGDGTISHVYFQVSSETCSYFKFDASGSLAARYTPGAVGDADAIRAAYRAEIAARLPVKPLSALAGVSPEGFALAPPKEADMPTLYGVVVDGVNYVGGCDTRAGPYPFCDVMDLPSYSTAKSVVAAIGLMRLEKLWPGARTALIADYVPACNTPDWQGVTFENALNMMTGVYGSPDYEVDEDSAEYGAFFNVTTHADKIAFACTHYHRKSPPGTQWVYRTADTYVLGTAMQAFVRKHLGASADLYRDILVAQLWRRLGLSPVLDTTLRTYDSEQQFFSGYGLTYHRDDIARIGAFLNRGGMIGGEAMLDPTLFALAMQRDPTDRGVRAGNEHIHYKAGFWVRDVQPLLGCKVPTWVPFMSGYGGISVVMFPNGVVYYYFGDNLVFDWGPAAVAINKIRPICP